MTAEVYSLPAARPRGYGGFWAVEQLTGMHPFMTLGRRLGFTVTATPKAMRLLKEAGHEDGDWVANAVCPVRSDPWHDLDSSVVAARTADVERVRFGFLAALVGVLLCMIMAIERLFSIGGAPADAIERLALAALFGLIAWRIRPRPRR